MTLLDVDNLTVRLNLGRRAATIVEGLSLRLNKGEAIGIVGESGSGKSTAALAIMGLLSGRQISVEGHVGFNGTDLLTLTTRQLRAIQGRDIAMIFQDPMSSLNPVQRIGDQVIECLLTHAAMPRRDAAARAAEALTRVGMPDPVSMMARYPHQLSGGQRQRVLIAMAIVFQPRLLIADEPTTALDLTIQAQILQLLKDLARDLEMGLLLITHDLGVVAEMTEQVIVLYSGRDVERGPTQDVLDAPQHPYTVGLLGAHPSLDSRQGRLTPVPGAPPGLWDRPSGCAFRDRCARATGICANAVPPPQVLTATGHVAACVLAQAQTDMVPA